VQSFSVFVLYTIARFNWSDQANGLGLTLFGSLSVVSAVLVGTLIARFGARNVVLGGFACGSIGFLVYGFAPAGIIFACALPLTGVWAIAGPPIQSAMSRRVAASEQGELQGAIGSVRSIAMVVGPAFFTSLFALVSRHRTSVLIGAPWFCGAAPRCSGGVLPACHSGARTGCDGSRPTRKRGRAARSRLAAWSGAPSRASRPASIEAPAGGRRLHRPRSKTEDTTCITFHAERAGCLRGGTARRRRLQTR
jgi:MFS family permease